MTIDAENKEEERKAAQNERDDLLIVFTEVEEKKSGYKVGCRLLVIVC